MNAAPRTLFNEEVQMAAWGDSNTSGPWIKLRLADAEQLDVFRGMTLAKGDKAGQLLRVVIFEHEADPQPPATVDAQKPKGGALAQLAGRWCNDEAFQDWVFHQFPSEIAQFDVDMRSPLEFDRSMCIEVVRRVCAVQSRAEIDHSPEAAEKFERLIRKPFMERAR